MKTVSFVPKELDNIEINRLKETSTEMALKDDIAIVLQYKDSVKACEQRMTMDNDTVTTQPRISSHCILRPNT
jgi:hypothetical protein